MLNSTTFIITDPSTWNTPTDKPVLWNGVMLYDRNKKPITEWYVYGLFRSLWDVAGKKKPLTAGQKAESVKTVLDRMVAAGQTDPNWVDKEQPAPVNEDEPQKTTTGKVYGGYDFSEAQMEVVDGFSIEELTKIGEIIVSGRVNHKRSYQIEQDFFQSMGWDAHFFVLLDSNKDFPEMEENTMQDYFLGCEFDAEEDAREFFQNNPYLLKHQALKTKLIEKL